MSNYVLAVCLLGLVAPGNGDVGVFFVQKDPAYFSYNSWLVTLSIDLEPYENHVHMIRDEIQVFDRAFESVRHLRVNQTDARRLGYPNVRNDVTDLLEREVNLFNKKFEAILDKFQDIKTIALSNLENKRPKRSLLPFMGDVLHNLFGTATSKKMNKLKKLFRSLRTSHTQLSHFVEESVSIVNTSHHQLKENRNAINHLQETSKIFRQEITNIVRKLEHDHYNSLVFVQMINRIHEIFHVVSFHIQETEQVLDDLINQIQEAVHGNFPISLLPPHKLISILDNVKTLIPKSMSIPLDVGEVQMLNYYKFLSPIIIPDDSKFHVVFGLPILPIHSKFDIFEAVSMSFQDPTSNLSAEYILESSYLAFSKAMGKYGLISSSEIDSCKHTRIC